MPNFRRCFQGCLGAAAIAVLTACAPPSMTIRTPPVTGIKYAPAPPDAGTQVSMIDERSAPQFLEGALRLNPNYNGAALNPPQFLATHLAGELNARGLKVDSQVGNQGLPKLHLKTFKMLTRRPNGFGPFYTFTFLDADLESASGTKRIGIFIQADKVPIWSPEEIVEPTISQPMTIAVQELSSKVSNILFGFQASDTQVQGLMTRLADPNAPTRYLDTYALGFANNPLAIDKLAALTKDPDDYVRLAAISSLGTLHATAQMPLLKQIYEDPKALWQERAMAIKAIGDLDTLAAKAYLTAEFKKLASQPINDDNTRLSLVMMIYYR
jgi:hypothetical protein